MTEYILYHKGCDDGFGAAYAAWKALGDKAIYIPCAYGEPPPDMEVGAKVTLVDFSYKRDVLFNLREYHPDLTVIDHHKTAQEDLAGLDDIFTVFDMQHSGAWLAWQHFHSLPIPELLLYVEDRDLWRKALPKSEEVTAALRSFEQDFEVWDILAAMKMETLAQDGTAILRYINQQVDYIVNLKAHWGKVKEYTVPMVNSPVFQSEIAHKLCEIEQGVPFSVVYHDRKDGLREFSLRSLPGFDVSEVAKAMGGGGHENAAGFTTKGFHPDVYLEIKV